MPQLSPHSLLLLISFLYMLMTLMYMSNQNVQKIIQPVKKHSSMKPHNLFYTYL